MSSKWKSAGTYRVYRTGLFQLHLETSNESDKDKVKFGSTVTVLTEADVEALKNSISELLTSRTKKHAQDAKRRISAILNPEAK